MPLMLALAAAKTALQQGGRAALRAAARRAPAIPPVRNHHLLPKAWEEVAGKPRVSKSLLEDPAWRAQYQVAANEFPNLPSWMPTAVKSLVGGKEVGSEETEPIIHPVSNEQVGEIHLATKEQLTEVVATLNGSTWKDMPYEQRREHVLKAYNHIFKNPEQSVKHAAGHAATGLKSDPDTEMREMQDVFPYMLAQIDEIMANIESGKWQMDAGNPAVVVEVENFHNMLGAIQIFANLLFGRPVAGVKGEGSVSLSHNYMHRTIAGFFPDDAFQSIATNRENKAWLIKQLKDNGDVFFVGSTPAALALRQTGTSIHPSTTGINTYVHNAGKNISGVAGSVRVSMGCESSRQCTTLDNTHIVTKPGEKVDLMAIAEELAASFDDIPSASNPLQALLDGVAPVVLLPPTKRQTISIDPGAEWILSPQDTGTGPVKPVVQVFQSDANPQITKQWGTPVLSVTQGSDSIDEIARKVASNNPISLVLSGFKNWDEIADQTKSVAVVSVHNPEEGCTGVGVAARPPEETFRECGTLFPVESAFQYTLKPRLRPNMDDPKTPKNLSPFEVDIINAMGWDSDQSQSLQTYLAHWEEFGREVLSKGPAIHNAEAQKPEERTALTGLRISNSLYRMESIEDLLDLSMTLMAAHSVGVTENDLTISIAPELTENPAVKQLLRLLPPGLATVHIQSTEALIASLPENKLVIRAPHIDDELKTAVQKTMNPLVTDTYESQVPQNFVHSLAQYGHVKTQTSATKTKTQPEVAQAFAQKAKQMRTWVSYKKD